jgi:hypothetical protein
MSGTTTCATGLYFSNSKMAKWKGKGVELERLEEAKFTVCTSNDQLKVPTKDLQVRDQCNLHLKVQSDVVLGFI